MIIKRNMKNIVLEEFKKVQSPSGAWKQEWVKVKDVEVGIYPLSGAYLTTSNVKFANSTNTGLTGEKAILEGKNRLNDSGVIYDIDFVNPIGKYTQLVLKKMVANV